MCFLECAQEVDVEMEIPKKKNTFFNLSAVKLEKLLVNLQMYWKFNASAERSSLR